MLKITQNGTFCSKIGLKWSKTTVYSHFVVEKNFLGNYKFIVRIKIQFFEIIYDNLC